jgi:hypothetical protein
MRFTLPLLAVLGIAGAVRSADPRAEETGTLAQEYQKALKESGQIRPNFERSLVKNLKTKPFALIGVNIFDRSRKKLKEIMEKEKITWRSIASQAVASAVSAPRSPLVECRL